MHLWQFNAFISGYQAHLQELLAVAVFTGYYSGYYHPRNKRKKSPVEIIKKMFSSGEKHARKQEVDVVAFQALEQAFNKNRKIGTVERQGGSNSGSR